MVALKGKLQNVFKKKVRKVLSNPSCAAKVGQDEPPKLNSSCHAPQSTGAYSSPYFGYFLPPKPGITNSVILAKCLRNASPNPVTHPHFQLCTFPLCRNDSPGTEKSTGICVTWTPVPCSLFPAGQTALSLFLRDSFPTPTFCTNGPSRQLKELNALCWQLILGRSWQLGTTKSLLVLWPSLCRSHPGAGHSHTLLLLCRHSRVLRAIASGYRSFFHSRVDFQAPALQSRWKAELGASPHRLSPPLRAGPSKDTKNTLPAST